MKGYACCCTDNKDRSFLDANYAKCSNVQAWYVRSCLMNCQRKHLYNVAYKENSNAIILKIIASYWY